jgi:hypothetical protein
VAIFTDISKAGNAPVVSGWINPVILVIQGTIDSGESDGDVVLDSTASSPGVTLTGTSSTGQYSITYPKAKRFHFIAGEVLLAESAGSKLYLESYDPHPSSGTVGTATFEAATTPGTAADPAASSRIFIMILVERG